jgi:hypothetical protein
VQLIATDDLFRPIRGLQDTEKVSGTVLYESCRPVLVISIRTCKVNADMLRIVLSMTVARQNYERSRLSHE